jgi:hypothetical protein
VADADVLLEAPLELLHARPGPDPAAAKGRNDLRNLVFRDQRRAENQEVLSHDAAVSRERATEKLRRSISRILADSSLRGNCSGRGALIGPDRPTPRGF